MWEDVLLGIVNWVLVIALFPSLLSKDEKPAFLSSSIVGVSLIGISIAYISLSLVIGAIPAILQAVQWFVLAYQRYRINAKTGAPLWGRR